MIIISPAYQMDRGVIKWTGVLSNEQAGMKTKSPANGGAVYYLITLISLRLCLFLPAAAFP
jgi:hypothetical protein